MRDVHRGLLVVLIRLVLYAWLVTVFLFLLWLIILAVRGITG